MDQNEKRDLISRALGVQIPNPGSTRSRAKREFFDVSPRVGAVGDHFATVSLFFNLSGESRVAVVWERVPLQPQASFGCNATVADSTDTVAK